MEFNRLLLRHLILYEFNKDRQHSNATVARESLCATLGDNVVSVKTVRKWFEKFRRGNFNLLDAPRNQSSKIFRSNFVMDEVYDDDTDDDDDDPPTSRNGANKSKIILNVNTKRAAKILKVANEKRKQRRICWLDVRRHRALNRQKGGEDPKCRPPPGFCHSSGGSPIPLPTMPIRRVFQQTEIPLSTPDQMPVWA